MKLILKILLLIILFVSCQKNDDSALLDEKFDQFKNSFINQLWERNPQWASWAGLNQYDSLINLPSKGNREKHFSSIIEN
jgi:hypothetical protein